MFFSDFKAWFGWESRKQKYIKLPLGIIISHLYGGRYIIKFNYFHNIT
jgi:hypothetical protein